MTSLQIIALTIGFFAARRMVLTVIHETRRAKASQNVSEDFAEGSGRVAAARRII